MYLYIIIYIYNKLTMFEKYELLNTLEPFVFSRSELG